MCLEMDDDINDKKLNKALDLMRRMPPQNTTKYLADLIDLCPTITDELLSAVDQPLCVRKDDETQEDFIICDYNRFVGLLTHS